METAEPTEFYRALFEVNTAVKLIVDPDQGLIVDANQAACDFYGYSLAQLRTMRIGDINILPHDEIQEALAQCKGLGRFNFTFKHRLASGEVRDVDIYSGPVQIRGKTLLLSIIHDVTERRRLEEHVRHANRLEAVGKLAGGIAHDFNNLLTAIMGYADMIAESADAGTRTSENAHQIVENALRGQSLIRQLLAFSRQQVLQPQLIDINAIAGGMEPLLRQLCGSRIQLSMDLRLGAGMVRVDRTQMEQVILNLAVNARDAMPGGGELRIRTLTLDPAAVTLIVSDNGPGISPEIREHIFEPFFTTKDKYGGTGLGLSTVYGIVHQSGGQITVESEPGMGAVFVVTLPRAYEN